MVNAVESVRVTEDKSVVLELCRKLLLMDEQDFLIVMKELEKNTDPTVIKLHSDLKKRRGVENQILKGIRDGLSKLDHTDQKFMNQILTLINLHVKKKEHLKKG